MRFYPISYHQFEDREGVGVLIIAYTEEGERIAVRFRYTFWFYLSLENHSYEQLQEFLGTAPNVYIDPEDKKECRRSTRRRHEIIPVIRAHAHTYRAKEDLKRLMHNNNVDIFEEDNSLSPILKMVTERNVRKHQWMDVETSIPHTQMSKMEKEYIGILDTLTSAKDEKGDPVALPPPKFTFFSFDGEMDTDNWNKLPDANSSPQNAIRVLSFTYGGRDKYHEYALVLGPDITDVFKKYRPNDIESGLLKVYAFNSELLLIRKIFDLIIELDPDVLTGHNIINFDNQYINDRHTYLANEAMCKVKHDPSNTEGIRKGSRIPNISRLLNHNVTTRTVEWNNNQIAINGIYFDTPGRTWIDTLVVAGRNFLGGLRNNKLGTIGEQLLGMNKDEINYRDMFKAFKLYRDWQLVNKPGYKPTNIMPTREDVCKRIRETYERMLDVHNKPKPERVRKPTLQHINTLIKTINGIIQREKKMSQLSAKDIDKEVGDKKLKESDILKAKYDELRDICIKKIEGWNVPVMGVGKISEDDMLKMMWWLITQYCIQDTRIPYQVIQQQSLMPVLCEQSNVFSVDISDVLMRGQVFTTSCSQYPYNNRRGFMMDFDNPGGPTGKYDYGGGYVGKGEPGLKIKDDNTIIFVIDFASLYPTIMIAYNICYTTWVPPNMRVVFMDEKGNVLNKDYIWLKYEKHITEQLEKLKKTNEATLKKMGLDYIDPVIAEVVGYYMNRNPVFGVNEEIFMHKAYDELLSKIGDASMKDKVMEMLNHINELTAIIRCPYNKKGELMCNIFNVPYDDDQTNTHETRVHWFLRPAILKGIVPDMLWELYLARKEVKKKMADAAKRGDWAMFTTYNAQQNAIKVLMNATYGALGTETNRLALYPGAEVVTFVGRTSIQKCNVEIEKRGYGHVAYNDTDSAMVAQLISLITKERDPKKIKEYGNMVAREISKSFPKPMMLECENFFVAFFLKAPKMYAGIKWDEKSLDIKDYPWDYVHPRGLLYIKGMTPVRRDKFAFSKELFSRVLYDILTRMPVETLIDQLQHKLMIMWDVRRRVMQHDTSPEFKASIEKDFAYNMGVTTKALAGGSGTMAKWCEIYQKKYGRKPAPGERFELLVTNVYKGPDAGKITKSPGKLVTIDWMLSEKRELDMEHYIMSLAKDGQAIEIMHIAYPERIPRNCLQNYYIKKLKRDGHLVMCPRCSTNKEDPPVILDTSGPEYMMRCLKCNHKWN